MGTEAERKFLVRSLEWKEGAGGTFYRQGYLSNTEARTVRVRVAGDRGYLTIKDAAEGISRPEYEYAIPLADAIELLDRLCLRPLIEKTRYRIEHRGRGSGLGGGRVCREEPGPGRGGGRTRGSRRAPGTARLGGRGGHFRPPLSECTPGRASVLHLVHRPPFGQVRLLRPLRPLAEI